MTGRSQGYLAATACVLGFGACATLDERSDLRPSGPPEVLAVLASDDPDGAGNVETATFCKTGDDKRPGLVPAALAGPDQVCPDDLMVGADEVTDTQPVGWYIRIQFDELLNPDKAEDLLPITDSAGKPTGIFQGSLAITQPVTITCGKDASGVPIKIPYDGYYDPSGNSLTWPVGPSLFIQPNDTSTIATGTECELTINNSDSVVDKDGNRVPSGQLGPYTFKIAPLEFLSQDPDQPNDLAKPSMIQAGKPLILTFNATMDVTSLDPTKVSIVDTGAAGDCNGGGTVTPHVAKILADADSKQAIDVQDSSATGADAWLRGKTYIVTFPMGIDVKDAGGGAGSFPDANKLIICFKTDP